MGGYGSGGHNKYCKTIEDYSRYKFDSYDFYEWLGYDKYIHYKEYVDYEHYPAKIRYYPSTRQAYIGYEDCMFPLEYEFVDIKKLMLRRMYFICPSCGRRCRNIYFMPDTGNVKCRVCENLHYKSQQVSGIEKIKTQIENILINKFNWSSHDLINLTEYDIPVDLIKKPKGMTWKRYESYMDRLKELEHEAQVYWVGHIYNISREAVINLEKNMDLGKLLEL